MSQKVIGVSQARKLMEESAGTFFSVLFTKKDGSLREMNCRIGVSIGVNGTGRSFEPSNYDLLGVWDTGIKQHRMISLRNVHRLNIRGEQYKVQA